MNTSKLTLKVVTLSLFSLILTSPALAQQKFGIAGYKPNGSMDSTFGGDGKVIADFATAVAIDASGRIVVAGRVSPDRI